MIEDVVVQPVGGEHVAAIIGLVEGPVIPQALWAENEHAIVPQLVIFDDRKRLESFAEADAIRDDASADPLELIDCSDHAVALKSKKLLPDDSVPDTRGRLDDPFFIKLVAEILEQLEKHLKVNE